MIYIQQGNKTRVKEITDLNHGSEKVRVWVNGHLKVEALAGEILKDEWENWE